MPETTTDILMRIVLKGNPLKTGTLADFTVSEQKDMLRKDFASGYCCNLTDFSFSAGIEGALSSRAKKRDKAKKKEVPADDDRALPANLRDASTFAGELQRQAARFAIRAQQTERAGKRLQEEAVDMQPVDFTRIMDSSSMVLLDTLANSAPIDSLSIVKRKAAGVANSGLCYLRLDFKHVLLTRLDLKDQQQVVHESGTFIYRELKIRYRPQKPSGELDAEISGAWVMKGADS